MNILRRAAEPLKWLIVLVAVYSGVTQPVYLAVPKTPQQIEQCFARNAGSAPCMASACEHRPAYDMPSCRSMERACAPAKSAPDKSSAPRCCSLFAVQDGLTGARQSLDDSASRTPALLSVIAAIDIPYIVRIADDRAATSFESRPLSPPPSRGPPLS